MFSLLVGLNDGVVPAERLFEHTLDYVRATLNPDYASVLQLLPALSMPEVKDDRFEQVARIGTITRLRKTPKEYTFTFIPNPNLEPIASSTVQDLANQLGIDSREFTRTHWAVKDVDLFEVLLEHQTQLRSALGTPNSVTPRGLRKLPSIRCRAVPYRYTSRRRPRRGNDALCTGF